MSLFRPEALAAQTHGGFGKLRAGRSAGAWTITAIALALAASLITYGIIGEASRKARVIGILVASGGDINLIAPVAAKLQKINVAEGQVVRAGEVMFVLDLDHQTTTGTTTVQIASQLDARRASLDDERRQRQMNTDLRRQALNERATNLSAELAKLGDEIALQARRKQLAQSALTRQEGLAAARFISNANVEQAQEQVIDQDARLAAFERQRIALRRDQNAIHAELAQIDSAAATDIATLDRALVTLEIDRVENTARTSIVVTAPSDGRINASLLSVGQSVAAGQTLATMQAADTELEAQLYAPSRAIGFVQAGQTAQMRLEAYPYQKFGLQFGTVQSVSMSALAPNELPPAIQARFGQRLSGEALYRITLKIAKQTIAVYGRDEPLKSGLALEADIVQEKRRIVEWLFEPLFAFVRRAES